MYSNVAAYCCKICGAPPSELSRFFDARPIRDAGRNAVEVRYDAAEELRREDNTAQRPVFLFG